MTRVLFREADVKRAVKGAKAGALTSGASRSMLPAASSFWPAARNRSR
jgi:hypothetical protein